MKIIIFGTKEMGELAHYYLENDSEHKVVGFSIDGAYLKEDNFCGLPVIPFEDVGKKSFPLDEYGFFAPIYATRMNKLREQIYFKIKDKGYNLINYVSSKAYTWNAEIGDNCFIMEGCNLQPFSKVGNNVIIWSFTHLGHHSAVADHNFLSGNVVVAGKCMIDSYCFLGTNCSLKDGIHIKEGSMLGMDASVIRDTDPWSVNVGVPARNIGKNSLDCI